MRDVHWLEDVLLEIVIQLEARGAFDEDSRPVEVDAVLPDFAGLVYQRLGEVVVVGAGEFIDAKGTGVIVQARVEEGVAEAS